MKPAPTITETKLGAARWSVSIVSGQSVMEAGVYVERDVQSLSGFGRSMKERRYEYGVPHVGGEAPASMPRGAIIEQTDDKEVFLVTVRGEGIGQETKLVMGPEVFTSFGFEAPQ